MEPSAQFSIRLLGPVEVCNEQQPVHGYESTKALALLCYLATRDQPVSRQALVSLFWPDKDEARGRNNLSVVLHNLGSLLPGLLAADRQTVGLNRNAACWRDTRAFAELVNQSDIQSLAAAAKLYRGEFIEGLSLKDCPEFDLWLTTEREAWQQQIRQVLHRLAQHAYDQQEYTAGQAHAARLLELDPLDEAAHRQMMRLLIALDQRSTALEQYRTCCRLLETELAVQPAAETTSLYHQIRAGTLRPSQLHKTAAELPALPHNLPHPMNPFVGRVAELAQIAEVLHYPDCRLLTLTGLGGVGKTRLALQAAHQCLTDQSAYPDGVWFVSLASVESTEHVIMALVSELSIPMQGARDVKEQLLSFLRARCMLLILDNMEHLLDTRDLVAEILATAPDVTILSTSRERLNLPAEWVIEISGLELPCTDDAWADSSDYSAIRLFVQRARQGQSSFALAEANRTAVARICRNVEGVPLAIELAASWVNVLPCAAIADELETTLALLATRQRLVPERHQSMHAVFNHSWQLLSPREQETLLALSIFRGGFLRDAAEAVAGATLPLLAALRDKSLLRCDQQGRYSMHELLRQYAIQQLAERSELHERTCKRHSDYWLNFLHRRQHLLFGPHEKEAVDEVAADIENIRLAWNEAIACTNVAAIDKSIRTLAYFYYVRGWLHEGEQACEQTTATLRQIIAEQHISAPHAQITLGKSLTYQGLLRVFLGRNTAAQECLQRALELLPHPSANWERGLALSFLGFARFRIGEYEQAQAFAQKALMVAQTIDDAWMQGFALHVLSLSTSARGHLQEAARMYEQLVAGSQAMGEQRTLGMYLCELASIYHVQDQREQAHAIFEQCRSVFASIQYRAGTALVCDHLGRIYYNEGNYAESVVQFQASLAISREIGDNWDIARVQTYLGHALLDAGAFEQASRCFEEAAELAIMVETRSALLDALIGMARLLVQQGNDTQGRIIIHLVQQHPASHYMTHNRTQDLLATLPDQPEPAAIDYLADPATADLVQLAREAQHWLSTMPPPNTMQ